MTLTHCVVPVNQADTSTLSLGAWSTSLPVTNLQTSALGDLARSLHGTHGSTCFKVTAPPTGGTTSRVVALIRDNLTGPYPGVTPIEATQYRFRAVFGISGGAATFFPRALPVAILASSNFTGTVATVQEPDIENKAGSWLTATSGTTNTDVRLSLQASTCGLLTGAGLQSFSVLVRRTGGGGSNPTLAVDLYHSGSLVSNLASGVAVSSTVGSVLTYTWNASLLGGSPPAATGVEIRIRGTASATATVEVGGAQWIGEFASNGSVTVTDSGWLTRTLPSGYWTPQRSTSQLYLPWVAPTNFTWDEIWFEAQAAANFDGYFEAGRLWIGAAVSFSDAIGVATNDDAGFFVRAVDPSLKERMRSGALSVDRRVGWKELIGKFSAIDKTTALDTMLESLQRALGVTRPALWVPRPSEPERASSLMCLGVFKTLEDIPSDSSGSWSTALTIEEVR